MKRIKHLILSGSLLVFSADLPAMASDEADVVEQGYKRQIENLDRETKSIMDLEKSKTVALQGQSARRNFAAFYHKQKQYSKIPPLYEGLIERDKQLVHMGMMSNKELAQDYKYMADILDYLGRVDEAEKAYKNSIDEDGGTDSVPVRKAYAAMLRKQNRIAEAKQMEKDAAEILPPAQTGTPGSGGQGGAAIGSGKSSAASAGKAAGKPSSVAKAPAVPELARVEEIRTKAMDLFKKGSLEAAEQHLNRANGLIDSDIEPEVKRKMFAHMPGYGLDQWHACMLTQAEIYKDLADVYYKQGNMDAVRDAYIKRVTLRDSGGIEHKDSIDDYEYLVTLCQATGSGSKAVLYNVILLKAKRMKAGNENNPDVLACMSKFADFLRKNNETGKAAQLDARAKAIKSGTKPLPELWFSY